MTELEMQTMDSPNVETIVIPDSDLHHAFSTVDRTIGELRPQHVGRKVRWHTETVDVTGTLSEVSFKRGGVAVSIRIEESSGVKGVLYLHDIPRETRIEIES